MRKWKIGIIFILGTVLVPINTTSEQRHSKQPVVIQQTQSMISQLPEVDSKLRYTCEAPKPWEDVEVIEEPELEPTTELYSYEEPEIIVEEAIIEENDYVTGYVIPFDYACAYYGTYTLTAYAPTGAPCADGQYPSVGYTAACNDPNLWNKWVYIEGVGDRYIHDTGGMGSGVIDIFVGSYDEAVAFGSWSAAVYVYE